MKSRRILSIIGLILAAAMLLGIGFAIGKSKASTQDSPPAAAAEAEAARPQIFVENSDSDTEFHEFTAEELGIAFDGKVSYSGLSQVNIQIGDTVMPLEDALKNGEITVEALIADIRLDAEDKVCRERTASKLGLSRFIYQYRDLTRKSPTTSTKHPPRVTISSDRSASIPRDTPSTYLTPIPMTITPANGSTGKTGAFL